MTSMPSTSGHDEVQDYQRNVLLAKYGKGAFTVG
jgi:hypothetical protein